MAATDEVNRSREVILTGDVAYKRSVSEAILSRFASTNNFIAAYQTDIKEFKLNGSYSVATGITFFDGVASFFYNSEIVGINFYNGVSGSSGTTSFDLRYIDAAGVDQGTIMSTQAQIASTSSNNTVGFENYVTSTQIAPTGVTLPVLTKTQFAEGESIYLVLTSSMVSAQNCGLTIFYRPIN